MSDSYEARDHGQFSEQEFIIFADSVRPSSVYSIDYRNFKNGLEISDYMIDPRDLLPEQEGIHFSTEFLGQLASKDFRPCRIDFTPMASMSIGRENSRNGVFFGNLAIQAFNSSKDESEKVAVKPFRNEIDHFYMAQELYMLQEVAEKNLDRPEEIALVKSGEAYYAITRFNEDIITLDTLDWQNLDEATQTRTIARGLFSIAQLHQYGLFHGDAALKNITIQPNLEKVWHVDLELGVKTTSTIELFMNLKKDLRKYYDTLSIALGSEPTFEEMAMKVIEPYERLILRMMNKEGGGPELGTINKLFPLLSYELEVEMSGTAVDNCIRQSYIDSLESMSTARQQFSLAHNH